MKGIFFEKGSRSEANLTQQLIKNVFNIYCKIIAQEKNSYFKYNRRVKGYEPRDIKRVKTVSLLLLRGKFFFLP